MKANLNQREPEILKRWKGVKLQALIESKPAPAGPFILHDGPPYANGNIHIGHALNKILKDIVVRFQTMQGHCSPYVPGWDCHGLPIEQKVLTELGERKSQTPPIEIRKLCDKYARKWVKTQSEEFQRLGIGGRWDQPYLTLDPQVEVGILKALRDLVARGYVYKRLRPVFWCSDCITALADAEVEYANHKSHSIYVSFPIIDPETREATRGLNRPAIVIWTTTPWTLPANMAVSVHPDYKYVVLREKGEHRVAERNRDLIVAKDLAAQFAAAVGIGEYEIVREIAGPDLENLLMEHPVQPDRTSRMILGTHVTLEQGTGAVHTAPGHGMEDFLVCKGYDIPTIVPVDGHGKFTHEFSLMEGMTVWEANAPIIRYLDEKDILLGSSKIEHSYPHCWRCHNPIIYRATEQWFVDVDHEDLREKTLGEVDKSVTWIPRWGRDRFYNMVAQRPDWCISRQRSWGTPITALVCKKCGKSTMTPEIVDKAIEQVATRGSVVWFLEPVEKFVPEGFVCPECGSAEFEKEFNILDVWFESGSTHIAVLEQRGELASPADLYLEGSDQHRGWFMASMIVAMGARQRPPFRQVLTHGFVLDGKGEAMSKSKGNVIAPQEIIQKYGADVLRLWVASEDYRNDVKVSPEILERVGESYRRIRNTMRYLLGNLSDFDPATQRIPYAELPEIDRWVLNELHRLVTNVTKAYDEYEYHKIFQWMNEFCVVQLSSIYVDVLKDRMYCSGSSSPARRAAQTTQYELFAALARLMAPILVFTCDEAYQQLDSTVESVHLLPFPQVDPAWEQPELGGEWSVLLAVRSDVLRALEDARQVKKAIGQSLEAKVVLHSSDPEVVALLGRKESLLADLFITSQVELSSNSLNGSGAISYLQGERVSVAVMPAEGAKCDRCWRILPSVGADASHASLCDRCVDVVRRYY